MHDEQIRAAEGERARVASVYATLWSYSENDDRGAPPMKAEKFRDWLQQEKKTVKKSTIVTLVTDAKRIDKAYGGLDQQYDIDKLESVISSLRYTANDKRAARPNPSKLESTDPYKRFRRIVTLWRNIANFVTPLRVIMPRLPT